jgi:hypothetical protein
MNTRCFLYLSFLCLFTIAANAQAPPSGYSDKEESARKYEESSISSEKSKIQVGLSGLKLNGEQSRKVKEIQISFDRKDSIRITSDNKQEEDLLNEYRNAVKILLDSNQLKQYEMRLKEYENQKDIQARIDSQAEVNRRDHMEGMGFSPGLPGGPMEMGGSSGTEPLPRSLGQGDPGKQIGGPKFQGGLPGMKMPPSGAPDMGIPKNKVEKESQSQKKAFLLTIRLTKALNLNENQAVKVYQIQLEYLKRGASNQKKKEVRQEYDSEKRMKIRSLLNKKQRQIYDDYLALSNHQGRSKNFSHKK